MTIQLDLFPPSPPVALRSSWSDIFGKTPNVMPAAERRSRWAAWPKLANNWKGEPITEHETPDTVIQFWVITPGTDGADEVWIRSYQRAVEYAQQVLADTVDAAEEDDAKEHGVTVRMQLRSARLWEYDEVQSREA